CAAWSDPPTGLRIGSRARPPAPTAAWAGRRRPAGWHARGAGAGTSQALHKLHQRLAIGFVELQHRVLAALGLAAVPEDGFEHAVGAAVVQQARVAVDVLDQADAPQRRRF